MNLPTYGYVLSYLGIYICLFPICHMTIFKIMPRVIIQDHLKQIIIMDDGYQYFKKITKNPHSAMC
jgi:hypothetical protein